MAKMRHRAKFCVSPSSRCLDMAIFQFFKMAVAAILDFQNVIGVRTLKTAEMHHSAKFRVDRSNRC